jgi:hypothetical protein
MIVNANILEIDRVCGKTFNSRSESGRRVESALLIGQVPSCASDVKYQSGRA